MTETTPRDQTREVEEVLIHSVLKRFLGSHIVSIVRETPTIRYVLVEALGLALILGIVGHVLFDLPILFCFSVTLALFAEAVMQVHFVALHSIYSEWKTFRRKCYLSIGVIAILRLLIGSALLLPTPSEVYADVVRLGGFAEMFWQNTTSNAVLLELCLDALLLMVANRAVFANSRKAQRAILVIAMMATFLIATPINWPAVDNCVATSGVIGCLLRFVFGS
jgi:hypothetical protein